MTEEQLRRSASVRISAPPMVVYDLVRQLERMGEWSPENRGGRWVSGDGSSVGDQFEGDNRRGEVEWTFGVTVNAAEPGVVFAFHTGPADRPLVQWTYRMDSDGAGTTLTESWELLEPQGFIDHFGTGYPSERAAVVEQDLVTTLTRLQAHLESEN